MKIPKLEWQTVVVLVAFVAAAVVVWVVSPDDRGDILATLAVVGPAVLAMMRPALRGPALALLVFLGASGCGASALSTHATIGTVAVASVEGSVPLIEAGCDVALASCHGSAECIDRVAVQCRDARSAWSAARSSVLAYLAAIEVMSHADEGAVLPALGSLLRSMAHAYDAARVALAVLHVELPPLPAAAVPILAALMGGAS